MDYGVKNGTRAEEGKSKVKGGKTVQILLMEKIKFLMESKLQCDGRN